MDQAALNGLVDDGDSALIGSVSCLSIAAFNGGDGLFECSSERGPLASIPLAVSLRLTSAFFCLACVSHDSLILKLGRHGGRYSGQYGGSVWGVGISSALGKCRARQTVSGECALPSKRV